MIAAGRHIVKWTPGQPWRLYPCFDWHIGSPGCAEESLRRYVDTIARDANGLWLLGGDAIDAIGYRDKRFNPLNTPSWLTLRDLGKLGRVLFDYITELLKPIRHKCIGLAWGNHEDSLLRDTQSWERWEDFVKAIGAPDMGVCGFRDLVFQTRKGTESAFRILVHHGSGAAATPGGKINRLAKTLNDFPRADLVLIGHLHDQIEKRTTGIDADAGCTQIVDSTRLGVMCGTWLRTYSNGHPGYGEVRGYSPVPLGNPISEIEPASRDMSVRWPR